MLRPSRLVRSAFGALLALVMFGSTSFAQYYYQPAPRHYPAPRYVPEPYHGPGYYGPRQRYQERYVEDDFDYRPRRRGNPNADYGYSRRGGGLGSVCVTSRGNCGVGALVPIGSGCRCNIPGFGRKAGQVGG
jgi:hypothetical protein